MSQLIKKLKDNLVAYTSNPNVFIISENGKSLSFATEDNLVCLKDLEKDKKVLLTVEHLDDGGVSRHDTEPDYSAVIHVEEVLDLLF